MLITVPFSLRLNLPAKVPSNVLSRKFWWSTKGISYRLLYFAFMLIFARDFLLISLTHFKTQSLASLPRVFLGRSSTTL